MSDLEEQKKTSSISEERKRIENDKLREEWQGCCSKTNKHYLKFLIQISMGSTVMLFSMVQIAIEAPNPEIYFSLLSGTLGLFLPHPQIKAD
jgi:hypothetical protein